MMLSWDQIATETAKDPTLQALLQLCERGFPNSPPNVNNTDLSPFWQIRESLHEQERVVIYNDRVVIPSSLRPQVLSHLHAAHQGISLMEQRARSIIYWPGITEDIHQTLPVLH